MWLRRPLIGSSRGSGSDCLPGDTRVTTPHISTNIASTHIESPHIVSPHVESPHIAETSILTQDMHGVRFQHLYPIPYAIYRPYIYIYIYVWLYISESKWGNLERIVPDTPFVCCSVQRRQDPSEGSPGLHGRKGIWQQQKQLKELLK